METLLVDLGERSYPIELGWDTIGSLGPYLRSLIPAKSCTVISNEEIFNLYGAPLLESLEKAGISANIFLIPDGEQAKNLQTAAKAYDALVANDMERNSPIIALGGGVVGDLAGFVAATYMRGVPFVQVPTTLLAQVDSSVGGKVGVNHRAGKNLVGCFYQPRLVWIDLKTLSSLPVRELSVGMAEIVKYGVIQDQDFFCYLEENSQKVFDFDPSTLAKVVRHGCQAKAMLVARDEKEVGIRALLNYGHTFGHVLETLTDYDTYRHGEAVAIGMIAATKIALELGVCKDKGILGRQLDLLSQIGLPTQWPKGLPKERILEVIKLDKKARSGAIRMVLPIKLGEMTVKRMSLEDIEKLIDYL
ncbi:MAG: 3-dehydroquinate synthase [Clostridia bacterium]|nr:3-dehydroquinate synthase [Clostridia bacterium]